MIDFSKFIKLNYPKRIILEFDDGSQMKIEGEDVKTVMNMIYEYVKKAMSKSKKGDNP